MIATGRKALDKEERLEVQSHAGAVGAGISHAARATLLGRYELRGDCRGPWM